MSGHMIFRAALFAVAGAIMSSGGIGTSSWQLYAVLICMGIVQISAQWEMAK